MRIMITGGGTGGHTSPAVAIIEELRRRDPRLLLQWVGRAGNIEERISHSMDIPFRSLPVEGWPREKKVRKAWVGFKLILSTMKAFLYLRRFQPDVVIGVGGYVALPLMWAAQRMGIKTVIHEQNKRLGMTNRILAPRASRVLLSYPDTVGEFPEQHAHLVGNPVRAGFAHPPSREQARQQFNLSEEIPVVLVCGGSQGAATLNAAVTEMLSQLKPDEMQLLWMTGKQGYEAGLAVVREYGKTAQVFSFIDDMVAACTAADIIVSRAGASSTAEIAVLGKPSILVPYPYATDNHQEQNAQAFVDAGAASMILDHHCTGERLVSEIRMMLNNSSKNSIMGEAAIRLAKPAAAEQIGEIVMDLVFGAQKA